MPATRCSVSFTDSDGLVHTAHVEAESLYEAVALALSEFRGDGLAPQPASATEFVVAIEKPPVEHRIRLTQLQKWLNSTARNGPAGVLKREKLKELAGL